MDTYEKAYKAVLQTAKQWIKDGCTDKEKICLECVFPELRESEDERMINELQGFLDSFGADYFGTGEWQKFHDWLEKQKESLHISETCKENADSFTDEDERIRKWLIKTIHLIGVDKDICADQETMDKAIAYLEKQKEQKFDFALIKQAWYMEGYKDRDFSKEPKWIVKTGDGGPEYEENPKYGQMITAEKKHATFNEPYNSDEYEAVEIGNATCLRRKEQKPVEIDFEDWDTLGYIRDIVRKHVRRDEEFNVLDKWLTEHYVNQKPAWSEEDEKMFQFAIRCSSLCRQLAINHQMEGLGGETTVKAYENLRNWLSSRFETLCFQSKVEWSEEDEQYLLVCKNALHKYQRSDKWDANIISKWLDEKLKSLRPPFKPSEEQMSALKGAVNDSIMQYEPHGSPLKEEVTRIYSENLQSLYEQLKKLM